MVLPNIWSQGQLFAFSALDGNSFANTFVLVSKKRYNFRIL